MEPIGSGGSLETRKTYAIEYRPKGFFQTEDTVRYINREAAIRTFNLTLLSPRRKPITPFPCIASTTLIIRTPALALRPNVFTSIADQAIGVALWLPPKTYVTPAPMTPQP